MFYCSAKEDLDKERKYILEIDMQHGYKKLFLMHVYRHVKRSMKKERRPGEERHNFVPVPYYLKNLNVVKK